MTLTARAPGPEVSLRRLAQLAEGDFLALDSDFINQAELLVGETPKFLGRIGKVNDLWALEVTGRAGKLEMDTLRQ